MKCERCGGLVSIWTRFIISRSYRDALLDIPGPDKTLETLDVCDPCAATIELLKAFEEKRGKTTDDTDGNRR